MWRAREVLKVRIGSQSLRRESCLGPTPHPVPVSRATRLPETRLQHPSASVSKCQRHEFEYAEDQGLLGGRPGGRCIRRVVKRGAGGGRLLLALPVVSEHIHDDDGVQLLYALPLVSALGDHRVAPDGGDHEPCTHQRTRGARARVGSGGCAWASGVALLCKPEAKHHRRSQSTSPPASDRCSPRLHCSA